jgi:pimeloyl-ACP methyl ester carboxylesterase
MCARRFLIAVAILTLLAVAAAFAIFSWGGDVLLKQATPKGHFEAPPPSTGPDYAAAEAWLTRPGIVWPDDPTRWKPAGAPLPPSGERTAALFYVHPTTYLERDRWNAPLQPSGLYADQRTTLFLKTQASAFSHVAEVWAPRYRQAAFGAFLLDSDDARKALDLAYSDIRSAFDRFLREVEPERPIILAGHSQGALHLMRLLRERKDRLNGRLVAAYVVGWPISIASDLPKLGFPACERPDRTGCILSWMSFEEPANPSLVLDQWQDSNGLNGGARRRDNILCVNPITGSLGGAAPPAGNPGTLVPTADFTQATLIEGAVGARCDDGLLILDGEVPPLGPYVLPGNNYHVYDYALFWGAIRRDAERRIAAWRR